jgi:hypothetical protein
MNYTKKQAKIITQSLAEWENQKLLTKDLSNKLAKTIKVISFDWSRLARYSFVVSIASIIIAISAIFLDKYLMALMTHYFTAPVGAKSLFFFILSSLIFWLGSQIRQAKPGMVFRNEAIFALGVMAYAGGIYYGGNFLSNQFNLASENFSTLILFGCISYAIIGYLLKSQLIWISLGGWLGAKTGYMSGWGSYYLGMNYPLRFVLFGGLLTIAALSLKEFERFKKFYQTTVVMGLLYLFISLWILSIFGNYGDIDGWYRVQQIELFHWSLLFAFGALGAFVYGLKHDDATTRGFGLVFLFINLYTRFFEYFWNHVHKAIFFSLLALSLWYVGTRAETIWNLKLTSSLDKKRAKKT